ncbi:MAG: hypothetical protein QOE29_1870, partial [Gaiellaceae bacterium]|nr:hypothetical protein [Gaiellaceae bacterium]
VKGPPLLPLRLLAPVLVGATAAVFVTGVVLLLQGHRSHSVLQLHKISFIVWGVVFAVHFLAHVARVARSLRLDWRASRRRAVPGTGLRAMLVAASVGGGVALALTLLSTMSGWNGGHFH